METIKKKRLLIILVLLILVPALFYLGLFGFARMTNVKLCQDLEGYIPKTECNNMDGRVQMIKSAFPKGSSSLEIKSALGEYLVAEYPTTYGYLEIYKIRADSIFYILGFYDSFIFSYDTNRVLISFTYED